MGEHPPHRAELAEFLRAHREALTPEVVKLPRGRGRRTPGLRREEVALLAGVSVTWYTWLEQGRRINASTDVLRAIGRALRLDDAGQDHLVSLAHPINGPTIAPPDEVPSALRRLIDGFDPAPAYVLGPHWEFAAWNTAEARLYPRIERLEAPRRNLIWSLFGDPAVRDLVVDWDIHARQVLAEFRAATISVRHDREMEALVDELLRHQRRVPLVVARTRRGPVRDPAAPLQPSPRRPADVRVPAAHAVGVAGAPGRGAAPGSRRRLRPTPRRPPPRGLTGRYRRGSGWRPDGDGDRRHPPAPGRGLHRKLVRRRQRPAACAASAAPSSTRPKSTVDEVLRFEGQSDPDDEMIVFAVRGSCGHRGVYSAAYGHYMSPEDAAVIGHAAARHERRLR